MGKVSVKNLIVGLVVSAFIGCMQLSQAMAAPTFRQAVSCDAEYEGVMCGVVTVPENRNTPDTNQIEITVYVFKATDKSATKDPIVVLDGGPGSQSSDFVRGLSYSALREDRDLILVFQRGTWGDNKLCPEYVVYSRETFFKDLTAVEAAAENEEILLNCFSRLRNQGRDIDGYTNTQNALDIRDVRLALGIEKWNLWGISYGTALAQEIIRVDEAAVTSAVLDSVVPMDVYWGEGVVKNQQQSIAFLSKACAGDVKCKNQYGDIYALRQKAIDSLRGNPLTIKNGARFWGEETKQRQQFKTYVLNDHDLSQIFYNTLYDSDIYSVAPVFLQAVIERDAVAAAAFLDTWIMGVFAQSMDYGAYYAIACRFPLRPQEALTTLSNEASDDLLGLYEIAFLPRTCPKLNLAPAGAMAHMPVTSSVPVLFISGETDPITPDIFAQRVKKGFPNSQSVLLLGTSHGTSALFCGELIIQNFLEQPAKPLKPLCGNKAKELKFPTEVEFTRAAEWVNQLDIELDLLSAGGEFAYPVWFVLIILLAKIRAGLPGGARLNEPSQVSIRTGFIYLSVCMVAVIFVWGYGSMFITQASFPTLAAYGTAIKPLFSLSVLWLTPLIIISAVITSVWTFAHWLTGKVESHAGLVEAALSATMLWIGVHLFMVGAVPETGAEIWPIIAEKTGLNDIFYWHNVWK